MRRPVLFVSLFLSIVAGASTLLKQDLTTLTARSDAVVHGTVTRVQSRWSGDHLRIWTDVDLVVVETLKGNVGAHVTIQQPGGAVGNIGQSVSGLASFSAGEEVVVFLQRRGDAAFGVVGMAQGKYTVQHSSDGTRTFAIPEPLSDALLVDPLTRQPVPGDSRPLELRELRAAVSSAQGKRP